LPDPLDPCEDISDPSLTPTDDIKQQDEDPPSNSTVPTDQSPENILEVITPTRLVHLEDKTIGYQLPFRQNSGKPPNRYSLDIGKTSKYPIANHVSTEKLSEPLKAFVHQLSAIHIPTKISEALNDPKKYVLDLLTDTGMLDCKPADTPIIQNHHLGEYPDQVPTNKERYQRLGGRLIYLSHTRPDIAYAVSVVSQFMHSPSEDHMNAVLRILRYLKSAPGKRLFSKHGHLNIDGYSDADWAGNVTDRKSTSGYFTFVGGNLVTWRSKKQNVVALSSAEAEFRGMTKGICELLWLRKLLTELGYKPTSTMNLFCDNKAAIAIALNPV
ncbi:unnamed protein product, partial [Prunus brigantina]